MAIVKMIDIDGQEVPFKASAAILRIYRARFGRDLFRDLNELIEDINHNDENNSMLSLDSLEVFENIAYIMAWHADPSIGNSPEVWLDRFETFSIYQVLPEILKLWNINVTTDVESKKKLTALQSDH